MKFNKKMQLNCSNNIKIIYQIIKNIVRYYIIVHQTLKKKIFTLCINDNNKKKSIQFILFIISSNR